MNLLDVFLTPFHLLLRGCLAVGSAVRDVYLWSQAFAAGRILSCCLAFMARIINWPFRAAGNCFRVIWGVKVSRFRLLRRLFVVPALVLVFAVLTITSVQAAAPLFIAYALKALASTNAKTFYIGISSSFVANLLTSDKKEYLQQEIFWTGDAKPDGAEGHTRTHSRNWKAYSVATGVEQQLPRDLISSSDSIYSKKAFNNMEIHKNEIFGYTENFRHANLVGEGVQYAVSSLLDPDNLNQYRGASPVYYGGIVELNWNALFESISKANGGGFEGLFYRPDAAYWHETDEWKVNEHMSLRTVFDTNSNGSTEAAPTALTDRGAQPGYPCVLEYEIAEVGYGRWDANGNCHPEIVYGEVVDTYNKTHLLPAFRSSITNVLNNIKQGQGIRDEKISFTGSATRRMQTATEYHCKYLNMGDDGYTWYDNLLFGKSKGRLKCTEKELESITIGYGAEQKIESRIKGYKYHDKIHACGRIKDPFWGGENKEGNIKRIVSYVYQEEGHPRKKKVNTDEDSSLIIH